MTTPGSWSLLRSCRGATGRAVCAAFVTALAEYGIPEEVLSDSCRQFTGRFGHPRPATEVLFDRNCRENGITHRLTGVRPPTTTGKIERFHQSLRVELLDDHPPFADLTAAQAAIDVWRQDYNMVRPHQSLDMATPASRFRPARGRAAAAACLLVSFRSPGPQPSRRRSRSPAQRPSQPQPSHRQSFSAQELVGPPDAVVARTNTQDVTRHKTYGSNTMRAEEWPPVSRQ
jgi:Integrase core domain